MLSTRARKEVSLAEVKVPVLVYAFDCLYLNGTSLLHQPLTARREALYGALTPVAGQLAFATHKTSTDTEELQVGWHGWGLGGRGLDRAGMAGACSAGESSRLRATGCTWVTAVTCTCHCASCYCPGPLSMSFHPCAALHPSARTHTHAYFPPSLPPSPPPCRLSCRPSWMRRWRPPRRA